MSSPQMTSMLGLLFFAIADSLSELGFDTNTPGTNIPRNAEGGGEEPDLRPDRKQCSGHRESIPLFGGFDRPFSESDTPLVQYRGTTMGARTNTPTAAKISGVKSRPATPGLVVLQAHHRQVQDVQQRPAGEGFFQKTEGAGLYRLLSGPVVRM